MTLRELTILNCSYHSNSNIQPVGGPEVSQMKSWSECCGCSGNLFFQGEVLFSCWVSGTAIIVTIQASQWDHLGCCWFYSYLSLSNSAGRWSLLLIAIGTFQLSLKFCDDCFNWTFLAICKVPVFMRQLPSPPVSQGWKIMLAGAMSLPPKRDAMTSTRRDVHM